MAKFRFRLATLQKLRESHRDELRTRLAEAYQAQQKLADQIANVENELTSAEAFQREAVQGQVNNVNRLLETQRYQAILRSQIASMQEQHKMIEAECEKRRQAVVEADRQVRVLEKLHTRQLGTYQAERIKREFKEMDEVASRTKRAHYP